MITFLLETSESGDRLDAVEASYQLFETNAPPDYDGFGTFTVEDLGPSSGWSRLVMVRKDKLDWQLSRYSSGMHKAEPVDDPHVAESVCQTLWNRLEGKVTS